MRLASLRAPRRADGATLLVVFVCLLLMLPARLVVAGLPLSLTPSEIAALLLGLTWLGAQMRGGPGVAKGPNPVRTALFTYVVIFLVIYGYTLYLPLRSDEVNIADHTLVLYLGYFGLILAMCDGLSGRERLDAVLRAIVVAGAFSAMVALLQFRFDIDLTAYMRLPGLRHTSVEESSAVISRSDLRRVSGTLGHPIEFGAVCAMLLPLAAHVAFHARALGRPALRWWICTAMIAGGLMFSVSRTAALGLAGAAVILFAGWPNRRRLYALGAFVAFLGVMKVLSPGLLGTFYNLFAGAGRDPSIRFRTHDWPFAMREFWKSPLLGRGPGTWFPFDHQVFDNQYLLSLVETGLVGTLAFVGLVCCGMIAALRARSLSADPHVRNLGLTVAAALIIPLLGAATFDMLSFPGVTSLMFLLVGAAGAMLRFQRADQLSAASSSAQLPADLSRSLTGPAGSGHGNASSASS